MIYACIYVSTKTYKQDVNTLDVVENCVTISTSTLQLFSQTCIQFAHYKQNVNEEHYYILLYIAEDETDYANGLDTE